MRGGRFCAVISALPDVAIGKREWKNNKTKDIL